MKSFSKNILTLGVTSALSLSALNYSQAATYEVVEVDKSATGYTYGGKLNSNEEMAVSGSNSYNFPVQFEYFNATDYSNIVYLALTRHDYYFGLDPIEDSNGLEERANAGNATANDLAWSKLYLQEMNKSSSKNPYFKYQVVADTAAMTNLDAVDENVSSTEMCIFDTDFSDVPCSGVITRSTVNVIQGITNAGTTFGTASAPYLPMPEFTDTNGNVYTHWLREHGQRGFFSPDNGTTIYPVAPIETRYGGGVSAVFDMNDNGEAVGYSSYKLSEGREEDVLDPDTGCVEPNRFNIPYEICVQYYQSGMYHIQAFKAFLSDVGDVEIEQLGLLITPHADDERAFSSQALAVNNNGVTVGYAHGWDNKNVTSPVVNERMTGSYAVMFKEDEAGNKVVFDFNQLHYKFSYGSVYPFSRANDVNDSGIAVGYTHDINTFVKKFFYVDTNLPEDEMEVVIPKDFFTTSKSTAYAINSSGIIVGEGEIETHNSSQDNPRRTAGFMFDTASDSPVIIDINTLIECNSKYNILKANDINNAGQISATAVVKSESYDSLGEPILDDSGNAVMVDVVRAVLLNPIPGGEVTDCGDVEEKVERQGASFSSIALFSLFAVFGLRRRKFKK
jgi:hypothetical protein